MQFRDLKTQYQKLKPKIDQAISEVLSNANFISGNQVKALEEQLAEYVGVKHCITCGSGTDALTLALKALKVGADDAVFVPDFTFFASAETVALEGATPIFVDVEKETFNIRAESLRQAVDKVKAEGDLIPKAVIAVDLFGLPADYPKIREITDEYGLYLIEDGAQGFGGRIGEKKACSFGDISATSFFPAKPLGCYGDGGAVFTDNDEWASVIRSLCVHGKGDNKYDNIRIGMNSRLDTIQAAVLKVKLKAFQEYELDAVNRVADYYTKYLSDFVKVPVIKEGFYSSWAQYSILLENSEERDKLQCYLRENGIPSMIYYPKTMYEQAAFQSYPSKVIEMPNAKNLCDRVLALPMHPYLEKECQFQIIKGIADFFGMMNILKNDK